ncbi:MAG: UDP-N-acetylmuramate--L-alanine ligase [Actinomycetota bacterium]
MSSTATPWSGRHLHFIGIGGAGMSGLAVIAAELGAVVSGSDAADSPYLANVRAAGVDPIIGPHALSTLPDGKGFEIVVSSAIAQDNPERLGASQRGVIEHHRSEILGELSALKRCIAITGTHGKTTTTAMTVCALRAAGMDPAYVAGAILAETGTNAAWGSGEWIVIEADESDRSLLNLHPEIAVLTNLELDHHSTYQSLQDLEETIRRFLAMAPQAVICDEPRLLALRDGPAQAYGIADADVEMDGSGSRFSFDSIAVSLPVPGIHNALNATGALTAARLAGANLKAAALGMAEFAGTGRRFERVGVTAAGAVVYDDYAHHPTEVAATLQAARTFAPKRLVAVFQPHLYSRTAALYREFGEALALADTVVVVDVYRAREDPAEYPGVSGLLIASAAADAGQGRQVAWMPGFEQAERFLRATLREGDLMLALGAGNIDSLARLLVVAPDPDDVAARAG